MPRAQSIAFALPTSPLQARFDGPQPNFLPGDESCGPLPGQPGVPTPDGLWCEYGWELAPAASVTMTLGVQISQVDGYNPPVWAMVGCATILPRGGGTSPPPTCAASALAVSIGQATDVGRRVIEKSVWMP
jgi:hypothetical protein